MNIKNYIFILFAILSCGCSVNDKGLPLLYKEEIIEPFKNNLSTQVQFTSYGLHIDTRNGFIINFGYIRRNYIYPLVTNSDVDCSHLPDSTVAILAPADTYHTPIKVMTNQAGISGELSPTYNGIFIGYRTRNVFLTEVSNAFTFYQSDFTPAGVQTCALITASKEKT